MSKIGRNMATSTFKLYTIEGIDYNAVIAKYRQICEEGIKEINADSFSVYGGDIEYLQVRKPRKPLNDDTKILNKAKYLIHTISYRQLTNRDSRDGAYLQYAILQSVIGKDVYELLKALEKLGYIHITYQYIIGKHSMLYKVNGDITSTECVNYTIKKYINKTKQLLKDAVLERLNSEEFKKEYGESFGNTYIKNLNLFKVKDLYNDKIMSVCLCDTVKLLCEIVAEGVAKHQYVLHFFVLSGNINFISGYLFG